MTRGKVISIQKINKTDIILIEYEKNDRLLYCYHVSQQNNLKSITGGDTVLFEEKLDVLGPVAINLSKLE